MSEDDFEQAECGCRVGTVGETFVVYACALGERCDLVRYAIAETERQSKPYSVLS